MHNITRSLIAIASISIFLAIGCEKDKAAELPDISFGANKLSGIYITSPSSRSGFKHDYLTIIGERVMRQSTNHLFGSLSLSDLKDKSYLIPYPNFANKHPDVKPSTSKRVSTTLCYEKSLLEVVFLYTYQLAGVWHLGSKTYYKDRAADIDRQVRLNANYWFYIHLYGEGDGGRERVVIESAGQPGQCLANEGHYSSGDNYPRFFLRNTQAEIDAFLPKWEIGKP